MIVVAADPITDSEIDAVVAASALVRQSEINVSAAARAITVLSHNTRAEDGYLRRLQEQDLQERRRLLGLEQGRLVEARAVLSALLEGLVEARR